MIKVRVRLSPLYALAVIAICLFIALFVFSGLFNVRVTSDEMLLVVVSGIVGGLMMTYMIRDERVMLDNNEEDDDKYEDYSIEVDEC